MSGIVVHHLNNSRSQRILWLLEELNVPYEIKHYQRGPDQRAPKELKDVHPLGKSPVITDNGKVIAESGVIVDYLIKKYGNGKFLPKDEGKAYDDNYWSHFAEGSLMPALVLKLIFQIIPGQAPFIVRPLVYAVTIAVNRQFVDPEVNTKIAYVADEIAKNGGGWFAGGDKDGDPVGCPPCLLPVLFPRLTPTLQLSLPVHRQQQTSKWLSHSKQPPHRVCPTCQKRSSPGSPKFINDRPTSARSKSE